MNIGSGLLRPIRSVNFNSMISRLLNRRGCSTGQGELKKLVYDPIFSLNHTCAMLRANLNRLFRKTWCTTKTVQGLVDPLSIHVRYHNTRLTPEIPLATGLGDSQGEDR